MSQVSLGKFVSERPCWLLAAGHYNSQVEFKVSKTKTETETMTKTQTQIKRQSQRQFPLLVRDIMILKTASQTTSHLPIWQKLVPSIIQKLFLNKKQILFGPKKKKTYPF